MSLHSAGSITCDGPACPAAEALQYASASEPPGWIVLRSTAHIPSNVRSTRTTLSSYERMTAGFQLHLCRDHWTAFDAHRPITNGRPATRTSSSGADVSCSCGFKGGWRTRSDDCEQVWRSHLPAELRGYPDHPAPLLHIVRFSPDSCCDTPTTPVE